MINRIRNGAIILKHSVKNVFRSKMNKILMIAIFIGCLIMTLSFGYNSGLNKQLEKLKTVLYTGDITITSNNAVLNTEPQPIQFPWDELMVLESDEIRKIENVDEIEHVSRRFVLMASAYGENESINEYITVVGLDFHLEKDDLFKHVLQINPNTEKELISNNDIFLSDVMCRKLKLKKGDSVYLFFVDEYGMLTPTKYNLKDIYTANGFPEIVEGLAFINYLSMISNFRSQESFASTLNIKLSDTITDNETVIKKLQNILPNRKVYTSDQSGAFIQGIKLTISYLMNISKFIIMGAILLFSFSALFIAIHNRSKEIGIMNSMGLSKVEIFTLIILESAFLGLIPSIIAGIIGILVTFLLSIWGIPAVNDAMRYMFASDKLFFAFDNENVFLIIILVTLVTIIGSIAPIIKVIKLNPIEVIK